MNRLVYFIQCHITKIILSIKRIVNRKSVIQETNRKTHIIVSLTSIPSRYDKLFYTLESIFDQTLKPDKIVLYLGEDNKTKELPSFINEYKKRGLIVEYREDKTLKCHTKYFYAIQEYPDDIIITLDDDIMYHKNIIRDLYNSYIKHPNCISTIRPHKYKIIDNKINSYTEWIYDYNKEDSLIPNHLLCPTGVGGVLYPPHILPGEMFNKEFIKNNIINQDDIYLLFNELKYSIKVVRATKKKYKLLIVDGTQEVSLSATNVIKNKNDSALDKMNNIYNIDFENMMVNNNEEE